MHHSAFTLEAVAVVEVASMARGYVALDALVKKARVTVKKAEAVSPGKLLIVFCGDVESVRESREAALEIAGTDLIDEIFLPGAHRCLLPALEGAPAAAARAAVGLVETTTSASAVAAADTALKAVDVDVVSMRLALGIGGKGFFTIAGDLADVEAALSAARDAIPADRLVAIEIIAQPQAEARGFMG